VMTATRDGRRAAWRFAATSAVTAATAIAAAAPAALAEPAVFLHNIVLYPLGLTRHLTPAASPLPGHLLAATGAAGHWAAICLLLAAGLAVAAWILLRRPADSRAVAWRLAAGLCVMVTLAPATRWGYFAYPLGLLGWLGLTGRDRAVAGRLPAPGRPTWLAPAVARLTPAMAGLLASPGTNATATALARPGATAATAFRPWQRSPDRPALRGLLARVRDPGALPHLRPPAGPDWAGLGPEREAAHRRSPEPGAEGPGHSLPRIPRVPETRRHRWH
jgi:hypothetical protein